MADEEQNKDPGEDPGAVNGPGEDKAVTTADAGGKAPRKKAARKKAAKKKAAPKKKAARKKVAAKSSPVPADAAVAGENTPATPPADAASGAGETPSASVAASSAQKGGETDTMGGDAAQAVAGEGAALKSRQNERLQEKLREMGIMADESREAPVSPTPTVSRTKHPAPHRPRGMLPKLVLGVLIVVAGFMYIKSVAQKDPSPGVGDSVDVSTGGVMPVTGEGETVESIPLTNPAQETAREAGDTNASPGTTDGSEIHPEPAPGHTLTISEEQNVTSENGSAQSSDSGSGYEGLFRPLELSSPLSGAQEQGGPDTHGQAPVVQPPIVQRPMIPAPEQGVEDPPSTTAPVREPGAAPEAQPSAVAETATTGGAPEAAQEDSSTEGAGGARAETATPPGATLPATPYPNYMGSGRRQAAAPERPPWVQERLKRIDATRQQRRWGYGGAQGPAPSAEPGLPTATYRPRLPGDFYRYGTYPYPYPYPPAPYGYASPPATNNAAGSD